MTIGGTDSLPLAVLRMRQVNWAQGSTKRPSLLLYVRQSREDTSAVSYSWADGGATRVGINLRWMQASCTIEDAA